MTKLLLAPLLFILISASHWNQNQVEQYVHHSELQRRSSWHLLSSYRFRGDEAILDIGCGDGRNSAWMSRLAKDGRVNGIDPSSSMINWAKRQYHPIEFPNLNFEHGDFDNLPPDTVFDVITSFFSLHLAKDKPKALQNVYDPLKNEGTFICVCPPGPNNKEYDEALILTMKSNKWREYFTAFASTFRFVTLEDYKHFITESGLKLLKANFHETVDPFVSANEFIQWFKGTMPHIHLLPLDKQDDFVQDIITCYITLMPQLLREPSIFSGVSLNF